MRVLASAVLIAALSACGVETDDDGLEFEGAELRAAPVNLNTATVPELEALPGIGTALAKAIVADRTAKGPFFQVADVKRVAGIGDKIYQRARRRLTVGTSCDAALRVECGEGSTCVSDPSSSRAVCLTTTECDSIVTRYDAWTCGDYGCFSCDYPVPTGCTSDADCGQGEYCQQIWCITTPCNNICEPANWVQTMPRQCNSNPWQQDAAANPGDYTQCIPAPNVRVTADFTEFCQITTWLKKSGIGTYGVERIPAPSGTYYCLSCACARGDTIKVAVQPKDAQTMIDKWGWTEVL